MRRLVLSLLVACAAQLCAQPAVTAVTPNRIAPRGDDISATFSAQMNPAPAGAIRAHGNMSGQIAGSVSGVGTQTMVFNPSQHFAAGELVEVSYTTALTSTAGTTLGSPRVHRFVCRGGAGPGIFTTDTFTFGATVNATCVALGDVDGDGDMDVVIGVNGGQNVIHLNEGLGRMTGGSLNFGTGSDATAALALADVDGDGDLDIAVGNNGGQSALYLNNGAGSFSFGQNVGAAAEATRALCFGDIDGDGDRDLLVGVYGGQNRAWLNNGSGGFSSPVSFGTGSDNTRGLDLADIDADGDLDVSVGNYGQQSLAYLNDGAGNFNAGTRNFGAAAALTTAVCFVQNSYTFGRWAVAAANEGQSYLHTNDGAGNFTGNIAMGGAGGAGTSLAAGDLNGDVQFDLVMGQRDIANSVLWNNIAGQIGAAVDPVGTGSDRTAGVAVADMDGDGDLDLVFANDGLSPCQVCLNGATEPTVKVTINGKWMTYRDTVLVPWNSTPASLGISLEVRDPFNFQTALYCAIGNETTQGLNAAQWENATAAVPYTLSPSSGTFNARNATMDFQMFAVSAGGSGMLEFFIKTEPNVAPKISVSSNGTAIGQGTILNVPLNSTLAALGLSIGVTDFEGDAVALNATISQSTTQGFVPAEFQSASQATPYSLAPTSGVFNVAGANHLVSLSAPDGMGGTGIFSFRMKVSAGANSPPNIHVSSNGIPVAPGGTLYVANGSTLAALGLVVAVSDPEGDSTALAASVGNNAAVGILNAEFSSAAAGTPYSVAPTTGAFNVAAGSTHLVQLSADDGNGPTLFDFTITAYPGAPAPLLEVREGTTTGPQLSHNALASGGRAFGGQDTGSGATAAVTIVVMNAGAATLSVGTPTLGGTSSSEFVLNATGFPAALTAGQSASFTVAFDPATTGTKSAFVNFTHDDATQVSPFVVNFTGTGTSPGAVQVSTMGPLPSARVGEAYGPLTFQATGGTPGYVFSLFSGSPPPGLTLNSAGELAGTPVGPVGLYTFTVRVSDSGGGTDDASFQISVAGPKSSGGGGGGGGGCALGGGSSLLPLLLAPIAVLGRRRRKV